MCVLFPGSLILSQNDSGHQLQMDVNSTKLPRAVTLNPSALVFALTKDKAGDKEKFDAIFTWVASNISYNYAAYFSANGSSETNIKRLLKSKTGICLDYATLMDTLCELAGISNVTVYGYVRDELSDMNDSLYFDNHAWNAVKLNGQWYVYDVTFAVGERQREWTRFSKRVIKWREKFPVKYKRKRYRRYAVPFVDECGIADTVSGAAYYYKQRIGNRLLRYIISRFKLKTKVLFINKINEDYYLCEPRKFFMTHLPDDPRWSLLTPTTLKHFEQDSGYYFFNDSTMRTQVRAGVICPECDAYASADAIEQIKQLRKASLKLNHRNFFMPAYGEFKIGQHFAAEADRVEDSLAKVSALDSAMFYFSTMKQHTRQAYKSVDLDFVEQSTKNRKKLRLALDDNAATYYFIRNRTNSILLQQRKIREIVNRAKAGLSKHHRVRKQIGRLRSDIQPQKNSRVVETLKQRLEVEKDSLNVKIDFLTTVVSQLQHRADSLLNNLSLNIWQKVLYMDTLGKPISERTRLRIFLKDNYKKEIKDINLHLEYLKKDFVAELDNAVLLPSQGMNDVFKELFSIMDKRYNFQKTLYINTILRVKYGMEAPETLSAFKSEWTEQQKEYMCWLKRKGPLLKATRDGINTLRGAQSSLTSLVYEENYVERARTHVVTQELLRRKKKYRHISVANGYVARMALNSVRKTKRDYLNMLKRERRKKK